MKVTIARSLLIFGSIVAATFIATIGMMIFTLSTVKIEGPEYFKIIAGKDLVADILPPPMFLVEAYSLASEVEIEPTLAADNLPRISQLKAEYEERLAVWRASDLPDNLKQIIETQIVPASERFWRGIDEKFIPA
jgi:methyl-accepting chemotaxis protein